MIREHSWRGNAVLTQTVAAHRSTIPPEPAGPRPTGPPVCPCFVESKGLSDQPNFEATRGFSTCCQHFTNHVAITRARLASGWLAAGRESNPCGFFPS